MYAVITGVTSGIGREIAQRGLALVVTDRDEDRLATLVDELERACGNRSPILDATPLDISDHDAVHDWAEQIIASHGAPAHVYHAAGIAIWGDVRRMPDEKWQKVIDVNLLGTVNMVRAWTPAMANAGALAPGRRGKKRTFMAISSAAAIIGLPWHAAYSASKAGVLGMCEVLRFDLAPHGGIGACCCPWRGGYSPSSHRGYRWSGSEPASSSAAHQAIPTSRNHAGKGSAENHSRS